MPSSHPYISGVGNISQMINHLRKAFPPTVDSSTVKRLGIASNNESYVINALQYVGVIDDAGKKTDKAALAFSSHKDEDFQKHFEPMVKTAYSEIFDLHGDAAWELPKDELISFFRLTDNASAVIGGRQAGTFQVFAALAGHGELPNKRETSKGRLSDSPKNKTSSSIKKTAVTAPSKPAPSIGIKNDSLDKKRDIGLTVRVEINLPSDGTKEIYDNIFKSIKENLLND